MWLPFPLAPNALKDSALWRAGGAFIEFGSVNVRSSLVESLIFLQAVAHTYLPECTHRFRLSHPSLCRVPLTSGAGTPFLGVGYSQNCNSASIDGSRTRRHILSILGGFSGISAAGLSLSTPFARLKLSDLSMIRTVVTLRRRFRVRVPSTMTSGIRAPRRMTRCVCSFLGPSGPRRPSIFDRSNARWLSVQGDYYYYGGIVSRKS